MFLTLTAIALGVNASPPAKEEVKDKITEKLKMDSEVRWYRDEYKEILKKYESVQDNLEKEIEKKERELAIVNRGLGISAEEITEE